MFIAVGTNRYLHRLNKGPTAMLKILAETLPLPADPGEDIFHNFDFDTVLPANDGGLKLPGIDTN
jgi:hypothetical protein